MIEWQTAVTISVVEEDFFLSKADYMEISPGPRVTKGNHLLQLSVSMTSWVWVDLKLFTTQFFDKNATRWNGNEWIIKNDLVNFCKKDKKKHTSESVSKQ